MTEKDLERANDHLKKIKYLEKVLDQVEKLQDINFICPTGNYPIKSITKEIPETVKIFDLAVLKVMKPLLINGLEDILIEFKKEFESMAHVIVFKDDEDEDDFEDDKDVYLKKKKKIR